MLKQFYEKVLPTQGVYCITAIDKNKNPYNRFANTLDQLVTIVEGLKQQQTNIFIAPGSFKNFSRRAENSAYLKSFFIDLDVGANKPYDTKDEACEAVQYLLDETGLPPPAIVDSGGGIHAYWVFDTDVSYAEWKPYAEKFKARVSAAIPIDAAVTADAARIMRAPETLNHKYAPPLPTSVISTHIPVYEFTDFKVFLGEVAPDPIAVLANVQKGLDEDTKELLKTSNIESLFDIIAVKSMDGVGCGQIRYAIENAATLSEPVWHSVLSIARQCTDWEESIHELSREYPQYNPADTLRKANETLGKPHSCDVFNSRNPGICGNCPHRGKITNALALGRHLREASQVPQADAVRQQQNPEAVPTFPDYMKPYAQGADGGIYYLPPSKADKKGVVTDFDPLLLTPFTFYPIKRMYSSAHGECLLMRVHLPNDGTREFALPMKSVYAMDKLKEALADAGVSFIPVYAQHLMNYIVKWSQFMITAKTAEQMRMQMGWTDDRKGFVVGHREIRHDKTVCQTAASPMVNVLAKLLRPEGSYDLWRSAADKLNMPGFEMHQFTMFAGFGSPLMSFTSTSGGAICLMGPSGNAKTGALYAALSIYGAPKELCIAGENSATENGMRGWLMGLKNIVLGLDEVSNMRPEPLSNLLHTVSQGKGKVRMQASINAVREVEQNASLLAILTSNQSMYDRLQLKKASPDGEVARLIEFIIARPIPLRDNPELGKQIFDTFRTNYGHAVFDYVNALYELGEDEVKRRINHWIARFEKDFGNDNAYRFYANIVGTGMAGGEIAADYNIIHADIERIYRRVVAEIKDIRDKTIKINDFDFRTLIGEFMYKNQAGTLVINNGVVAREPHYALVSRVELDSGMYYVSKTEFKKYLATLQVSAREFEEALTGEGTLTFVGKQRLSNGWSGTVATPVAVYGFKIEVDPKIFHE